MRNLVFSIFVVCCLFTTVPAQRQKNRRVGILVDASKPAVFVSFLRLTDIKQSNASDDSKYLFFTITNNTRWNILLDMSGVSDDQYGDASLYYAVENKKDGTVKSGSTHCHVCSVNSLGSGRSIVFSVPLREASRDTRMRLAYSFEWEKENGTIEGSYSMHSVEFYFSYLAKSDLPQ